MSIERAKRLDLKLTRPLTPRQTENSEKNRAEALAGRTVLESRPRRLVLELTSACNIRCKMCGRNASDFRPTFFQPEWLELLAPIAPDVEEVTLLGWGEPTLHPQFSEFMAWGARHGLRIFFCTNGTRLGQLRQDIFDSQCDLLSISLDGADAATNDAIRCGSGFEEITARVKEIVAEKKRRGTEYPYLTFVMTMMKSNFRQLPDYVRLAHECGVDEIKGVYFTAFDEGNYAESLFGMAEECRAVFKETERVAGEYGIAVKLPVVQGEDEAGQQAHKDCFVGWRDFFLGSDGYVRPCMSTPQKLFHISAYGSFDALWNGPEYQAFRGTVNHGGMPAACQNCYQAAVANWNRKDAFDQRGNHFSPEWEPAARGDVDTGKE